MSDNLRDRIAKALYGQILHPVPLFDSQPDEVKHAWLADADAVIEALGLEVERGGTYEVGGEATSYRYVTEWTTNE